MRLQALLFKSVGLGLNLWSLLAPEAAAKRAFQVFSTPPTPRLREKERAFLDTARTVRRQSAGQNIVEYHWGPAKGPLALLSYGWGYNAGRWRHFVPELVAAGFRVIAYDPPGHGQSPGGLLTLPLNAAIIADLIEAYGPAEVLLGHSFGGSSGVYALQNLPRYLRPRRMVVMASFSYAPYVFQQYRQTLGLWSPLYWRMVRRVERHFGTPLESFDVARLAGNLADIPVLLVHDPADTVTSFAEALRYHDYWPDNALLRASGGHHLGRPETTLAVLDFLREGTVPAEAARQERPLQAEHELAQYFAGF